MTKTVMIVEDDEDTRHVFQSVLSHVGYEVLAAGDVDSAEQILSDQVPDFILLDIGLPGRSGAELCDGIKHSELKHIRVVAFTAHHESVLQAPELRACFDGWIMKPAAPSEVIKVIEEHIGLP